jgi:hypothetical protein
MLKKTIFTLSFLFISTISFGQLQKNTTKIIKGFILDNSEYTRTKVPVVEAKIQLKGSERNTFSDQDGKFKMEANKGDTLIVSRLGIETIEILITDEECYAIDLNRRLFEPLMGGRNGRKYKRQQRKVEKSMERKIKDGFYDCSTIKPTNN